MKKSAPKGPMRGFGNFAQNAGPCGGGICCRIYPRFYSGGWGRGLSENVFNEFSTLGRVNLCFLFNEFSTENFFSEFSTRG
jgi:hypothetical protein